MRARSIFRGIAFLALAGVACVAALLVALRVEHSLGTVLPPPSGPFPVGRAAYAWRDDTGVESPAPVPGTRRELLVWIWYPAVGAAPASASAYLPDRMRAAIQRARRNVISELLTRDLAKVRAHVLDGAAVAQGAHPYPVVLLRGGASAEVWNYTTLAADLASHGYVVVGVDAPWRTGVVAFPDGRVIRRLPHNNPELVFGAPDSAARINVLLDAWTADMRFVLDRLDWLNAHDSSGTFVGRLDLRRVGAFGHSLGGVEAAQFCHDDVRCGAAIDVNGAPVGPIVRYGVGRPFMFLLGGHADTADAESRAIMASIRSIHDRLPSDERILVELRGANHFLFSDDGAFLKSHLVLGALRRLGVIGLAGPRQVEATSYCVRRFFDAYLLGVGERPPRLESARYPEIRLLR